MGWKNWFFQKSLKVIFLSSLNISDGSGVQIWCPKLISDLRKMRFLTFPIIEILSPNPSEMMTLRLQILNFLCFEILILHCCIVVYMVRSTLFYFGPSDLSRVRAIRLRAAFATPSRPFCDSACLSISCSNIHSRSFFEFWKRILRLSIDHFGLEAENKTKQWPN